MATYKDLYDIISKASGGYQDTGRMEDVPFVWDGVTGSGGGQRPIREFVPYTDYAPNASYGPTHKDPNFTEEVKMRILQENFGQILSQMEQNPDGIGPIMEGGSKLPHAVWRKEPRDVWEVLNAPNAEYLQKYFQNVAGYRANENEPNFMDKYVQPLAMGGLAALGGMAGGSLLGLGGAGTGAAATGIDASTGLFAGEAGLTAGMGAGEGAVAGALEGVTTGSGIDASTGLFAGETAGVGTPLSWTDYLSNYATKVGDALTKPGVVGNGSLASQGVSAGMNYLVNQFMGNKAHGQAQDLIHQSAPINQPQRLPYQQQAQELLLNPQSYMQNNPFATNLAKYYREGVIPANVAKSGNPAQVLDKAGSQFATSIAGNYNELASLLATYGGFNQGAGNTGAGAALMGQGNQFNAEAFRGAGGLVRDAAERVFGNPEQPNTNTISGSTTFFQ